MRNEDGKGRALGKKALAFSLPSHLGTTYHLQDGLKKSHVMLAFYPGGIYHPVCTGQFCDLSDHNDEFAAYNLNIIGISNDKAEKQAEFAKDKKYPFTFLEDSGHKVAKSYGCNTLFMLGGTSRAIFIIHQSGIILYRFVEPTILTRRGSLEILSILDDLKKNSLI